MSERERYQISLGHECSNELNKFAGLLGAEPEWLIEWMLSSWVKEWGEPQAGNLRDAALSIEDSDTKEATGCGVEVSTNAVQECREYCTPEFRCNLRHTCMDNLITCPAMNWK